MFRLVDAPEWLLKLAIKEAESGEGEEIDLAALGVSERIRALITAPPDKGDRSEALMSVVNGLVAADVDSDTIYRVFEHFPIGAKYREKGTGRKAWLRAHIKKAKAFVKAGKPASKPAHVGYTCAELMKMDFPPPKWTVENVLPEGLSLLCGKPKQGKSFLALNVGSYCSNS